MRAYSRPFLVLLVLFSVNFVTQHGLNSASEKIVLNHPKVVKVVHFIHLHDFMTTGAGPFGAVENVFAREWCLMVMSKNKTVAQKLLAPRWLTFQPLGYWVVPEKTWHHKSLEFR